MIIPGSSWCQQFVSERGRQDSSSPLSWHTASSLCNSHTYSSTILPCSTFIGVCRSSVCMASYCRPASLILASNCLLTSLSGSAGAFFTTRSSPSSIRQKIDSHTPVQRGWRSRSPTLTAELKKSFSYYLTQYHQRDLGKTEECSYLTEECIAKYPVCHQWRWSKWSLLITDYTEQK